MTYIEEEVKQLKELMEDWLYDSQVFIPDSFYETVVNLRNVMDTRIELPSLTDKEFQKELLHQLKTDYDHIDIFYDFTDEELSSNRVLTSHKKNDELIKGMKITKYLSKKTTRDQRLDQFSKRRKIKKYYLTSDWHDILTAYNMVETCYSPMGENSYTIFYLLLSKFVYLVHDEDYNARMLVLIDDYDGDRNFYMANVYGQFDSEMPVVVAKYMTELGFNHIVYPDTYFDLSILGEYIDFSENTWGHISYIDNDLLEDLEYYVSFVEQHYDYKIEKDCLNRFNPAIGHYTDFQLYTDGEGVIIDTMMEYCDYCADYVNSEDYDYENEVCIHCRHELFGYCEECMEFYLKETNEPNHMGWCNSCLIDYAYKCEICGEYYEEKDILEGTNVCHICAAEHDIVPKEENEEVE